MKRMAIMALAAVVTAVGTTTAQPPQTKPAAIVNGEPVPVSDLYAVLRREQAPPNPPTVEQKRQMEMAALNMLIDDLLMRQFLRKNMPAPVPADVQKEFTDLVQALEKEKQNLQRFLSDSGQTEVQLRQDLAARLQWKGYILPRLPDPVVQKYYTDNKIFFDKVFVRASHILVKVAPNASQADRQAAYARILAIKKELDERRIDFTEAAKKYSDCPTGKANGGDLGPFPYKFVVVEPFAKEAFKMQIGQISGVVATEYGYHLIKVTERTPGLPSTFDPIKDFVREIYAQDVYQTILVGERQAAKIEILWGNGIGQ